MVKDRDLMGIMLETQSEPTTLGWSIPPIYGDFGDGLLLGLPHFILSIYIVYIYSIYSIYIYLHMYIYIYVCV